MSNIGGIASREGELQTPPLKIEDREYAALET
jgi:hypothetical protein